ncbi:hypothetical protein BKA70DRAFT_503629 [Coprinopsis sp. MPI-PUGE-AT-0042]|nr:hypothetical protein BKA70DRAFT_503629 [Coprinopsis sp. MPI-PUGE-AT-0042]
MPTNGRIHRFVGISLEYIHGAEKQHAAADVSNIGFIANGLDHTLSLASSSLNHWTAKDSSSLVLSSQAGSLVVVLRDKDLDAIAHIVISHAERAFWDAVPLRPGYKPSRRVQMQNFSDAETGRWLLSWQIETESKDKNSQPTPVQQDNKRRSEPHEEAVYLTNLVAVYTPEDDEQDAAQADISKLVLTAGDQRWSLTLNSSSLNHWEAEVNSLIDM